LSKCLENVNNSFYTAFTRYQTLAFGEGFSRPRPVTDLSNFGTILIDKFKLTHYQLLLGGSAAVVVGEAIIFHRLSKT
jgi:hypothetical protein